MQWRQLILVNLYLRHLIRFWKILDWNSKRHSQISAASAMKEISSNFNFIKTPAFIKITAFSIVALSFFYLGNHFYDGYQHLSFSSTLTSPQNGSVVGVSPYAGKFSDRGLNLNLSAPPSVPGSPPKDSKSAPPPDVERVGIVDKNGAMSVEFEVGEVDLNSAEDLGNSSGEEEKEAGDGNSMVKFEKFRLCEDIMQDYIPCLDNVEAIGGLNSTERGEKYERHCPEEGKGLDCLVPAPKSYKHRIPWPASRDEVWFSNVPVTRLVEDKRGQNWISIKGDKFIFPGGGTQFIHGADQYLDQISKMVPDIAFGNHTRVVLDIGCGVASFGAFLLQRNVTTLSVAPKDVHENQIQFALERGVPAMVAVLATQRLLYPSQAFELIHCSRCRLNWTRDDGILLLEVNRMLRAGGYFTWAAQPVYKNEENLQEQWKEMEDLTIRLCWELVKKEGYIAIWRKPLNNSCYLNRDIGVQPPLCDSNDDPDDVWHVGLKPCISRLPENGYGANITAWPARLNDLPERLQTIEMDAYISRKEIFKADSKFWREVVGTYVRAYHWKDSNLRNVMDMRAGFGGFAAALADLQVDCWVMNVVPVSGFNTLPVIYDRGLIGVRHDWCEPFDTYPRTYDLLHATGLFSIEQKRCNISNIMLEMDRILRPGGRVYIRDTVYVVNELQEIATAMGWASAIHETSEGPYASWRLMRCDKRF